MTKIYSDNALISALLRSPKPLTILIGSALSLPDENSIGVPGVSGIVERIKKHVESVGLIDEFNQEMKGVTDSQLYQKGLEFVAGWQSQDAVNQIIIDAVKEAYDPLNEEWGAPNAIVELCDFIKESDGLVRTILTTNFDPLIQKRLKKIGVDYLQINLDSDGSLANISSSNDKDLKIVHLHGFWDKTNSLHTQAQLQAERPQLKASLKDILFDTTMLIIGYGGWDDVFINALGDATYENNKEVNILWAFYEKDELRIINNNKHLFTKLQKFITQGRFKPYAGIDCKNFFGSVLKKKNM
ncbi:SIR2 family protein [Enterobacter hormaechei]|uniref:SIR2 family protein n=1 Tax=Enterobacter hormaechei TaxID=158836 RepID=UPI00321D1C37